ncbi:hypothetical protein [Lewinella sp. W8]|uniref:hypothetical protein n=1 Tax=Lewinella sp. W8 TaxID=2528208 RepID=UPI001068B16F|nr:hypothetical protein [Lewinella sp. W8]MTB53069.1 hypothetical protein [Lewinella sp. W8]
MKFEFARSTEVTDFAKEKFPEQYREYSRLFICPDVNDAWLFRLLPGVGMNYYPNPDAFLLERDKIANDFKGQPMTVQRLFRILKNDDLSNWDYHVYGVEEDAIEVVDGGFGIPNLKEPEKAEDNG